MRKPTLTRAVRAAVTTLTGLGAVVLLLLLLGAWTGSATATPSASRSLAPLLDVTAGITLAKTAPAIVYQALGAGQTLVDYNLTLQNPNGYSIAPSAIVSDGLPASTTLAGGITGLGWSGVFPDGWTVVTYTLNNTATATSIDVGGYLVSVTVPAKDKSAIVNTYYCFSGTVGGTARSFCENTPVTTTIRAPDFSLAENPSAPICAGGRLTYTLRVTNPGGVGTIQDFTIKGSITSALNVLTDTILDGGVWNANTITWTVTSPGLSAGGANAVTRTFAVTIPANTPHGTLLTNTYTITSPEVLPNVPLWQSSNVMVARQTAAFTSTALVCQNTQVEFQNNSTGATSYQWNFGDGSPITSTTHPIHLYVNARDYTVILTATGACGTAVTTGTVTVRPLPTPAMQIVPDPTQLGITTRFTDTGSGGASWNWNFGDGVTTSASVSFTNHTYIGTSGLMTTWLTSTAATGCYSIISRSLQVNPGVPYTVTLSAWPLDPAIHALSVITAHVTDLWGNPVLNGTAITFTASPPSAALAPLTSTTSRGLAYASVTSVLTGTVAITGTAPNGVSGAVVITFTSKLPYTVTLVAVPSTLPVSHTSTLAATVYDVSNALMVGQVITFTTSSPLGGGALIPLTATTNAQGQAMAIVSSTLTGTKQVTATTYNLVTASTNVNFYSSQYLVYLPLVMRDYTPPSLILTANPLALMVGDTTTLTATALDGLGAPIAGLTVTWSLSGSLGSGALTPFGATTNINGQITATLRSTVTGSVQVTAQASNGTSASVNLHFQGAGFCAPEVWYTIPSASGPMGVAYDAARDRLFVAHRDSHRLAVIGAHSGQIIRTVTGLPGAQGVAFDAGRNRAYVIGGDILYIVDAASYSKLASIRLGTDVGAHAVAYHPTADKIYVTGYLDHSIKIVNAATGTVITKLIGPQISEPAFIAVNPVTNKVYVSNHNGGLPFSWVTVIDGNTNAIFSSISLGGDLYGITADSVHNRVYVASISAARLYAIDGASDTPIGDIQIVRAQDGRPVPLRQAAVNPSAGSDTHLWLTSSRSDLWGMDRLILLSGNWPAMGQPRAASVAPSPEGGLMFDPASWFVFASSPQSNLVSVSLDSTSLCPTPLSLGADAERVYTVVREYERP